MLAGLHRHQRVAEHVVRRRAHLVGGLGQPHAALGVRTELLKLALAAAAGVDLRLDDVERAGELARRRDRLVDAHRGVAGGDGDAERRQQFLGLVFVNVHGAAAAFRKQGMAGLKHRLGRESTLYARP